MAMSNKVTKAAEEIESNLNTKTQGILRNDEHIRFVAVSKPTNKVVNNHYKKSTSNQRKFRTQQVTNSAQGSINKNSKNPEKYSFCGSEERQVCVSGSGTKNSNKNCKHAQRKNRNKNPNKTYATKSHESTVSNSSLNDKRSTATINRRKSSLSSPNNVINKSSSSFGSSDQTFHKNTIESPILHSQILFKFEEKPTETNLENVQKNQIEKCSEENTNRFPSEAIFKSKLNPNAKEFVFNPNTELFVQRFPIIPKLFDPMIPQTSTTNILSTFGQNQQIFQPQYALTTDTEPMFTHHPHMSHIISPTEFIAPNVAFNNNSSLMFPQPLILTEKFCEMTIGMSHRNDKVSQNIQEATFGQPLLAPAPFQTTFGMPHSSIALINAYLFNTPRNLSD